jgi:pimeloyl-ACP methyl ester carboxylesterase
MPASASALFLVLILNSCLHAVWSDLPCSSCPHENTCCVVKRQLQNKMINGTSLSTSGTVLRMKTTEVVGCIPGTDGICCLDDEQTGCGHGYICDTTTTMNGKTTQAVCISTTSEDLFLHVTPRYNLLSSLSNPTRSLSTLYGLIVNNSSALNRLVYFSSHGDITLQESSNFQKIQIVVIVIHGADNNADDYFYSGAVAAHIQPYYKQENVLIIAPWFKGTNTSSTYLPSKQKHLAWKPLTWDDTIDTNGIWRYGALDTVANISSLEALDQLLRSFIMTTPNQPTTTAAAHFSSLHRIVVVGHSSGGQFLQRWALLSTVCSKFNYIPPSSGSGTNTTLSLRVIVSNPSSYCYLDPRRWTDDDAYIIPIDQGRCPNYNRWPFGLDESDNNSTIKSIRYKEEAIRRAGGVRQLIQRYANVERDIIYLSGGQDRCNISSSATNIKWNTIDNLTDPQRRNQRNRQQYYCNSHGLETTCSDMLQGNYRLQRTVRFYRSLQLLYPTKQKQENQRMIHRLVIVKGVGHDHSLMFQSEEGIRSIFSVADVDHVVEKESELHKLIA